jgi:hypothetical protein
MSTLLETIALLTVFYLFMTLARYGHLKTLNNRAWYVGALLS